MVSVQDNVVNVTYKSSKQTIDVSEIEYIEACEWLSIIYTSDKNIICAKRLKDLQEAFIKYGFIRCHKGYIVNMFKISKINSKNIFLSSGAVIPIGRAYKETVKQQFNNLTNEKILNYYKYF